VWFPDSKELETIVHIKRLTIEEIIGTDWGLTFDLCYREFTLPLENGGCNSNYDLLVQKVYKLEDPCLYYLGKKWGELQNINPFH